MDLLKFEQLITNLFGEGSTKGELVLEAQDTASKQISRDFDSLADFIFLQGENQTVALRLYTEANELVALTEVKSTLPPTGYLVKGENKIPFWGITPVQLPPTIDKDTLWLPVPEVNGWNLETASGDFYMLEELQGKTLDKNVLVKLGMARNHKSDDWRNFEETRENIIQTLLKHEEGSKEGLCIIQGEIFEQKGTTRKASMMIANHILCLDLDNGLTFNEIDTAVSKTGLAYIRYTTHSHNAPYSDILKRQYAKFKKNNAEHPTLLGLREYLQAEKGYTADVSASVSNFELIDKAEGEYYRVYHAPVSKNRVIFFLKEPFKFRGANVPANMSELWKEKYLGFAESLGIKYDRTTLDAARLFFLPRHPKGRTDYESKFFDGEALDILKYPSIKASQLRAKQRSSNKSLADKVADFGGVDVSENFELKRLLRGRMFNIVDAIRDHSDGKIVDENAVGKKGAHIVCPFEDLHSSLGGTGTFAVNASENDGYYTVKCLHSHCQDKESEDFVKEMIDRGDYFPLEVLTDDSYAPLRDEVIEEDEEKNVQANAAPVASSNTVAVKEEKEEPIKGKDKKKKKSGYDPTILEEMNEMYASVLYGGSMRFIKENPKEKGKFVLLNKDAFVGDVAGQFKMGTENAANIWMNWENRRRYERVLFDPSNEVDAETFNTFRGFTNVTPTPGDWSKFKDHLKTKLCKGNEFHFNVLMTFFAHMIQRPWEKPGFALVITGEKGSGKSLIGKMLTQITYPYCVEISQSKQIVGNFNAMLESSIFVSAEEAFFAGDVQGDSVLKHLITNNDVVIENKGIDADVKKNYSRILFTSNEDWVIRASNDYERRYFCFELNNDFSDIEVKQKYFEEIFDEMENKGGLAAFMYDLQNWKPPFEKGWSILREAPLTDALLRQMVLSLSMHEKFFFELLTDGVAFNKATDEYIVLSEENETIVSFDALIKAYSSFTSRVSSSKYTSREDFEKAVFKHLMCEKTLDVNKNFVFIVPPLKQLQDNYNRKHQLKVKPKKITKIQKRDVISSVVQFKGGGK